MASSSSFPPALKAASTPQRVLGAHPSGALRSTETHAADSHPQNDAALIAALERNNGNLKAAAHELGLHPSRVFQRVLHGVDAFAALQVSVRQWLAEHTARSEEWLSLQPDPRDAASDARSIAAQAERRAVEAAALPDKQRFLQEAAAAWLEAASLEPTGAPKQALEAIDHAARAVDARVASCSNGESGPWPAIQAALAGDFSTCIRLAPPASVAGQTVASAPLAAALASQALHRCAGDVAKLGKETSPLDLQACLEDVKASMKAHPQHATHFLALVVDAYGRTGRLSTDQAHVRNELRAFGALCEDAVQFEGGLGQCRAKLYEADAWRLAGHPQRARQLLAEAAEAAGGSEAKSDVALARVRLEWGANQIENAIAATTELRTYVKGPEERALCDWLTGELWSELAQQRMASPPSFARGTQAGEQGRPAPTTTPAHPSLRVLAQLHAGHAPRASAQGGAVAPTRNDAQDPITWRNSAAAALDQARASFVRGRQELVPLAQGIDILPPSARRIAQGMDRARTRLRDISAAGKSAGTRNHDGAVDVTRLARAIEGADLLKSSGLALGRLLDESWLTEVGHASGQMGAFSALVSAPFDLVPTGRSVGASFASSQATPGLFIALGDVLRGQSQPDRSASDRLLGARIAQSLLPAVEQVAPPSLSALEESRLQTVFANVSEAFMASQPTAGPSTPAACHQILERLGFVVDGKDRYRYFGADPDWADAIVTLQPRTFSGVGEEAFSYELKVGAHVASQNGTFVFVPVGKQVHIGSLVFRDDRWARVEQGYQDTLARAASALRTANGDQFQPSDLADVRTLISLGRDEAVGGASRLDRARDRMELLRLSRRITEKAASLKASGVLEGFQLEIGEENAAGKTTIGQMALDAVGLAGFATRAYSPKAPSDAEKKQHPIQRHIDNGPQPGEAVFSDRTMAGSYAYNPHADESYLQDMSVRRQKWDEALFDAGIAQCSLQVNPGKFVSGEANDDYAMQTSYVMGKREARARVAQHLLWKLEAAGRLTPEMQEGLQAAALAGPGYRDLESIHTGEDAALRAEQFARRVSNPFNEWAFIGSLERHPSRVQILQTVLDKLEAYEGAALGAAREDAKLFANGESLPVPSEPRARAVFDAMTDAISQANPRADMLESALDGVAARLAENGQVELVLRRKSTTTGPDRMSRSALLTCAKEALNLSAAEQDSVRIRVFDPLWL